MLRFNLRSILYVLLCVILLTATGCSKENLFHLHKPAAVSNLGADQVLTDGNSVSDAIYRLVGNAKTSIFLEETKLDDPRLIQLLIGKHQQGVEVHVLLDQWENANRATMETLKNQNISAQFYPARKGQTDHVNLLVTDVQNALFFGPSGGANPGSPRDLAILLQGKAAWRAAGVFANDWEFTTTLTLNIPAANSDPEDNIVLATNANIQLQIQQEISASNQTIWLELSALNDQTTVQALADAARKRQVRILLDPAAAPVKNTPDTLEKLKQAGVEIRLAQIAAGQTFPNMGIFDDGTFIVSTSGWTYAAFVINHELSLTIPSPAATAKLRQLFEQDWANGKPI